MEKQKQIEFRKMGRVLTEEEKRLIISKLKSSVVATRFSVLRFINTELAKNSIDFKAVKSSDPVFFNSLIEYISLLSERDESHVIRKEAEICLENLKHRLKIGVGLRCEKCRAEINPAYAYCPNCGAGIKKQEWTKRIAKCEKCGNPVLSEWKFCALCGERIKEKEKRKLSCMQCGHEVEKEWVLCPYCGAKLKFFISMLIL